MKELAKAAILANRILHNETKYHIDKQIINNIFEFTSKDYSIQSIISRLTLIDSYYSTQMDKRYYGIEDIAEKIEEVSTDQDKVKYSFIEFAKNPHEKGRVYKLFINKHYGIHKNGNGAGMATSLISKYAYYQTGYQFPIYDSLVKKVYPLLVKKYFNDQPIQPSINNNDIVQFVNSINQLNKLSTINNYDKLDNLLWLTGKIIKGNFSLVLENKDTYVEFAEKVGKDARKERNSKTMNFSERIIEYLIKNRNSLNNIIQEKNLKKFIEFAINLKE